MPLYSSYKRCVIVNWPTAFRAGITLAQPAFNALAVEPVSAGQNRDFYTQWHYVSAYCTYLRAIRSSHLLVHLFLG